MRVEISAPAFGRLEEINDYLKKEAPEYRASTLEALFSRMDSLVHHPHRGRIRYTKRGFIVREIFEASYRIAYTVQNDTVHILTVEHMREQRKTLRFPTSTK